MFEFNAVAPARPSPFNPKCVYIAENVHNKILQRIALLLQTTPTRLDSWLLLLLLLPWRLFVYLLLALLLSIALFLYVLSTNRVHIFNLTLFGVVTCATEPAIKYKIHTTFFLRIFYYYQLFCIHTKPLDNFPLLFTANICLQSVMIDICK